MKKLFLLIIVVCCVACVSKTTTTSPNADTLTQEELLNQYIKEYIDSTSKAHQYFQQNLGSILPKWEQSLQKRGQEESSLKSDRENLWFFYSALEYNTTLTAYNKQLKNQFHELSDAVLKEIALSDIEQSKIQIDQFPLLRLLFAQDCKKSYWIDDIDVEVSGKRNQYLRFIGSQFSRNKHIQEFHEEISETCEVLRFEQVRYSWREGGGYEYFSVYEGKDNDPIPTILDWQYKWDVFPNTF